MFLNYEDILVITEICFEVIKLSLKVTSLLDNIDFEPRKRLFNTALSGETGHIVEDKIRHLFYTIGLIGTSKEIIKFPNELTEIINEFATYSFSVGYCQRSASDVVASTELVCPSSLVRGKSPEAPYQNAEEESYAQTQ